MTLEMTLIGDTQIQIARRFMAAPDLVFQAHTDPELLKKWCLGPPGWSMPVCINDPVTGGSFRWEWADADGNGFHVTGEYLVVEPPLRIVHVERMFLPQQTPDNHVETRFEPQGTGTLLTVLMTLPDTATRDAMLATGMTDGMEMSYARIDPLVLSA